jgi:hypothetical protein
MPWAEPDFLMGVYLCALIIITIIYIYTLIALFINRNTPPFNSSYFTLWINHGIIDIVFATTLRVCGSTTNTVFSFSWMHVPVVVSRNAFATILL